MTRTFASFPVDRNRGSMRKNAAAYRAQHAQLVKSYLGQYVAIDGGELVDHDPDPVALLERVRLHYPGQTVLRRKVETIVEREICIRGILCKPLALSKSPTSA